MHRQVTYFLADASVLIALVLTSYPAVGQSVSDEATALLLKAEQTSLQFHTDASLPYHERVKFVISGLPGLPSGEIKGQIIKDYMSGALWRERQELGDYQRITVRNGTHLGEFRSSAFEPLWMDSIRRSLPPVVFHLGPNDKVKRITKELIRGTANKCIDYESRQDGGRQDNEVCMNESNGTLTSLRRNIIEGACVLGCKTLTEWSDYTPIGNKLYPRHVRIAKYRTVDADVDFSAGTDLTPSNFRIPSNLEIRTACDKTTPARRIQGELPSYPHRMNEWLFEGTVAVQARIGVDGRVQEAQIATPHGKLQGIEAVMPGLEGRDVDSAILEAVRKWVFEPARCDGVPMVDNTLITFRAEVQ